ncbi:MAG TPA: serine hydrolase domain-containing protein [Thermoanaerobaculia bacterium]|nr:serine hydrolase domain-containing protein [Thermoanaerobaculia bacterium]
MKRLFVILALALPLFAADDLAKKIDAYVAPYVHENTFSGVVLIGKGDDIVFAKPYGMANYEFNVPLAVDTRFPIASITKMFTSAILARLEEENRLSPNDLLAKWVPDFPSADKITVQHLANHKSGIRDPQDLRRIIRANMTTAEVVDVLKKKPLGSAPGEKYSYTTANYAVLAHIIERVTGRTYAEVIRDYVYTPAGMKDSGELSTTSVVPRLTTGYMANPFGPGMSVCGPEDTSWKTGGGSSYSTARDLQRFMRAFYGGKLFKTKPIDVWPTSKMLEKTISRASGSFPGANAGIIYFIDDDVAIAVMSNTYSPVAGSIAGDVAAMYFGKPYTNPQPPKYTNAAFDKRLIGTWLLEGFPDGFKIGERGGRGLVVWNEIRQGALLPVEGGWFTPFDWGTITFKDDLSEGTMVTPWAAGPLKVTRTK